MKFIERVKLSEICKLSFGLHIKSPSSEGRVKYLQVKNFSDEGQFLNNTQNFTTMEDVKSTALLDSGDILFVSKGYKFFAYEYKESIGEAIASSIFYVIKVNNNIINPTYLTCILNRPKSLAYFLGASAGTSIPSIRKSELLDFEIPIPSLEEQSKIVEFYENHIEQQKLLLQFKESNKELFNLAINKLTEK